MSTLSSRPDFSQADQFAGGAVAGDPRLYTRRCTSCCNCAEKVSRSLAPQPIACESPITAMPVPAVFSPGISAFRGEGQRVVSNSISSNRQLPMVGTYTRSGSGVTAGPGQPAGGAALIPALKSDFCAETIHGRSTSRPFSSVSRLAKHTKAPKVQ